MDTSGVSYAALVSVADVSASTIPVEKGYLELEDDNEVPRVLFLGICLDFYYCLRRVLVPKFGFHFDRGSVSQALVKPRLVPP